MHRFLKGAVVLVLGLAATGCRDNDGLLRTQGRLLKGGEPFIPAEGEYVAITFVPIIPAGEKPKTNNHYWAAVDQETGSFVPAGAQKKGMPPGQYRVAVELMKKKKDQWDGKFNAANSPFVFEVDEDTCEIVIDLDDAPSEIASTGTQPTIESAGR